jgi:hypothetical protein
MESFNVNPEEVVSHLESLLKDNPTKTGKTNKVGKEERDSVKTGIRTDQQEVVSPSTDTKGSFKRPSYSMAAEAIQESQATGFLTGEDIWPEIEEVESILSQNTDELTGPELKIVLRGILKHVEHLSGYMEAVVHEQTGAIESLTRQVEFLGVPSSLKVTVPIKEKRPTFGLGPGELSGFFLPGNTPPTIKACRTKLKEIVRTVPGTWIEEAEIEAIPFGKISYLRLNWSEGTVVAQIGQQESAGF